MRDMVAVGRGNNLAGDRNPNAKLTAAKVRMIRLMRAGGIGKVPIGVKALASMFGVSYHTVWNACNRNWRHV